MAAGYGMALQALAGGVDGYVEGMQGNKVRSQMLGAYKNLPSVPDLQAEYLRGYAAQQRATPAALKLEQKLRAKYLPKQMKLAAEVYAQYLPQFAATNLATLKKVDPQFVRGREQLYGTVAQELARGSELEPEFAAELASYIRGAQAARGNVLGAAPVAAEALYKGRAGQQLKQQRIANMESFLRGPGPTDKFGALAGAGRGALEQSTQAASSPGYMYTEGPRGWAAAYYRAAADGFQMENGQEMARARMRATAPPKINPWLSSFQGGMNALAGSVSMSGGGKKK